MIADGKHGDSNNLQGAFEENKFHGQGKYIWEHGAYYIGTW
jgi:hypothetical protein